MGIGRRLSQAAAELWAAFFGWIPTPVGILVRMACWKPLFGKCGSVRFATGVQLAGARGISLGNGVRVGHGCVLTAQSGSLEIHDGVSLSPGAHVAADDGRIVIGAKCAIGPGCVLRAANHRFSRRDVPILEQGHEPGAITIGDDVWLGANCVVTPDVTIGRGAVVGAGAVVTRDVPEYAIAAGVPARVIGWRGEEGASGPEEE